MLPVPVNTREAETVFQFQDNNERKRAKSGYMLASLLTMDKPGDVGAYCRKLIYEVGDGRGFMSTMACGLVNEKFANTLS